MSFTSISSFDLHWMCVSFFLLKISTLCGSDGRASACNVRDPWVGKIPWRRKWQLTPVLLPGKFHEWRSLVGYTPWGRKQSDTTERLHFHFPLCHFSLPNEKTLESTHDL